MLHGRYLPLQWPPTFKGQTLLLISPASRAGAGLEGDRYSLILVGPEFPGFLGRVPDPPDPPIQAESSQKEIKSQGGCLGANTAHGEDLQELTG